MAIKLTYFNGDKHKKGMRQTDGSDLVGANDPRSRDIGIIYVTPNDEHKHVLAAILAQEQLQRKQVVIALPTQSGRSFRRLTDFEELINMQRKMRAEFIFIADPNSSSAKFALEKGFGIYISLERYKECLLTNTNEPPVKSGDEQSKRSASEKFLDFIIFPFLYLLILISSIILIYYFSPSTSIYALVAIIFISLPLLRPYLINKNKTHNNRSIKRSPTTIPPNPIPLQDIDNTLIVEAKPITDTYIKPFTLPERDKSEVKAITPISAITIEPPAENKEEQKLHIPRVFVSHSSKDDTFGLKLVQDLRSMLGDDEAVWYDAAGGIYGGDHWWDKIKQELKARSIFIVILSPNALASGWVQDEIRMAWRQKHSVAGKRIIPILYQPCDIPDDLDTLQIVSFLDCDTNSSKYQSALQALQKSLNLPGK